MTFQLNMGANVESGGCDLAFFPILENLLRHQQSIPERNSNPRRIRTYLEKTLSLSAFSSQNH